MATKLRAIVSQDRTRFDDGKRNLDLTYITPRIIAMGFPASGYETVWRNNIRSVAKMLKDYHGTNFMIWNLSERSYNYALFDHQIQDFGFPDHHNPPLEKLLHMVQAISTWLSHNRENVAIVHCKGGKGRTGTVIAALLLFMGLFDDPEVALHYFGKKRSTIAKGVTQPSQRRYVTYFGDVVQKQGLPSHQKLLCHSLIINTVPRYRKDGCRPQIEIYNTKGADKQLLYSSPPETLSDGSRRCKHYTPEDCAIKFDVNCFLQDDILIKCIHDGKYSRQTIFRMSLHTGFIDTNEPLVWTADELDEAKKENFDENFFVNLIVVPVPMTTEEVEIVETESLWYRRVLDTLQKTRVTLRELGVDYERASLLKDGEDYFPNEKKKDKRDSDSGTHASEVSVSAPVLVSSSANARPSLKLKKVERAAADHRGSGSWANVHPSPREEGPRQNSIRRMLSDGNLMESLCENALSDGPSPDASPAASPRPEGIEEATRRFSGMSMEHLISRAKRRSTVSDVDGCVSINPSKPLPVSPGTPTKKSSSSWVASRRSLALANGDVEELTRERSGSKPLPPTPTATASATTTTSTTTTSTTPTSVFQTSNKRLLPPRKGGSTIGPQRFKHTEATNSSPSSPSLLRTISSPSTTTTTSTTSTPSTTTTSTTNSEPNR